MRNFEHGFGGMSRDFIVLRKPTRITRLSKSAFNTPSFVNNNRKQRAYYVNDYVPFSSFDELTGHCLFDKFAMLLIHIATMWIILIIYDSTLL